MEHKVKTREEWVKEYRGLSSMDLRFFLQLAQGCLRGDLRMVEVGDPDERDYWMSCVEQGKLEISVIEECLAQQPPLFK